MTGDWDEVRCFPCHSYGRSTDASLGHQKSSRGLCCSQLGFMAAVNLMALPTHLAWHRRDAESRRGLETSCRS